ncbi:hypothetical protein BMETH_1320_1 [methanotrophic bacterial endosymbiont of Bathymodiolus sp.]|nr:hypothetical protein BMETH_1320_1 [methanotrophic bacterial endosymbiont of Bathymodiolus sp.]
MIQVTVHPGSVVQVAREVGVVFYISKQSILKKVLVS